MEYSISHVRLGECQKIEGIKIQILKIHCPEKLSCGKFKVKKIESQNIQILENIFKLLKFFPPNF